MGGGIVFKYEDFVVFQVQQMSLSKEAYLFWNNVKTESDPSNNAPYDTPPTPLIGNVYNVNDPSDYVLGYFEVSGVSIATIIVK